MHMRCMLIKNMKIKFNTNELSKARGVLSLAVLKNKEGALHLFSQQKGEDLKIVAYDDKNLQVTQYLSAEILGEDQVDKWLDKSFLNIVKAYADYGSNNIVMEYEIGDGIITFTDENGENTFKISERTPFKTLNEKVLVAQKPQSTISFKSEDLIAAMDAYAYPAVDHFNGMLVTESGTPDEREDAPVLFITRALSPHRLAKGFLQSIEVSGEKAEFYLTPDIRSIIKELSGRIDILVFEKCLILKEGKTFIICIKQNVVFPTNMVETIMDNITATSYGFAVEPEKLAVAVNMATVIGEKPEKVLIFSYDSDSDSLFILQKDQSAKVKLEATIFKSENFKTFALKPEFILDMIKSVKMSGAAMIAVGVLSPEQPVYFSPSSVEGGTTGIHVILPVNIRK